MSVRNATGSRTRGVSSGGLAAAEWARSDSMTARAAPVRHPSTLPCPRGSHSATTQVSPAGGLREHSGCTNAPAPRSGSVGLTGRGRPRGTSNLRFRPGTATGAGLALCSAWLARARTVSLAASAALWVGLRLCRTLQPKSSACHATCPRRDGRATFQAGGLVRSAVGQRAHPRPGRGSADCTCVTAGWRA